METAVDTAVLGSLEARPEWLRDARIQDYYSSFELNPSQFEYIISLESAARQLALFEQDRERLTTTISELETRLRQAHANHELDIERIGERLIEEANSREWCSVYDEVVADLNRRLNVELPTREREYTVEVDVSGTVRVTVTTTSNDDAMAMAREMINFYHWDTNDSSVEIYHGTIDDYRVID